MGPSEVDPDHGFGARPHEIPRRFAKAYPRRNPVSMPLPEFIGHVLTLRRCDES